MRISYLLTAFLMVLNFINGICQRPLEIEKVLPIIDSVQLEVNRLFTISKAKEKTLMIFKTTDSLSTKIIDQVCLEGKDTLKVYLIDKNKSPFYVSEYHKQNLSLIRSDFVTSVISESERDFINNQLAGITLINELSEISLENSSEIGTEFLFHKNSTGYSLYAISFPKIDSIFPRGKDYLIQFDHNLKIHSINEFTKRYKIISLKQRDLGGKAAISSFSLQVSPNSKDYKFLVPNLFKFRKYHSNLGVQSLHLSLDKRRYIYNAENNEIEIQRFPSEIKP